MKSSNQQQRQDNAHAMDQADSVRLRRFYQRVGALALGSQQDLERLAAVISEETAFSQLILRVVNSTQTGLFHPIKSLQHAVALLGVARVDALAEAELGRLGRAWLDPDSEAPASNKRSAAPSQKAERTTTLIRDLTQAQQSRSA
jgi:HD-like signal output (HDOD) protein